MAHPDLEGCPKQKWPEDGKSFENPTGPEVQLAALAVGVSIRNDCFISHIRTQDFWNFDRSIFLLIVL